MELERFQRLLDVYGADLRDWPEADRRQAEMLMGRSPEAGRLRERAALVDQALRDTRPIVSAESVERVLNRLGAIPFRSSPSRVDSISYFVALPGALSRPWVPAALAAMMMATGILLGGIAAPDEAYRASDFVDLLADRSLAGFEQ